MYKKINSEREKVNERLKEFVAAELKRNRLRIEKRESGFFWITNCVKINGIGKIAVEGTFVNQTNRRIDYLKQMKVNVVLYCNREKVYKKRYY